MQIGCRNRVDCPSDPAILLMPCLSWVQAWCPTRLAGHAESAPMSRGCLCQGLASIVPALQVFSSFESSPERGGHLFPELRNHEYVGCQTGP